MTRDMDLLSFAEAAPVAIAMFDCEMRYLAASRRYREDFQLGSQDLVGRSHYEVFPEISPQWREVHRRCLAGAAEGHRGERFLRADGSEQWIRWEIQPWHETGGDIGGIVLYTEDVTPQAHSEQAVRENEARIRLAQQVAGIGTFEWNIQTGKRTVTPELEAMYGVAPGGLSSRQQWIDRLHPEDRAQAVSQLTRSLDTGDFRADWRVVRPDGSVRWLAGRGSVIKDETGKPLRLIGANVDITERKQIEEALRESQTRLEAALASMTDAVSISDTRGVFTHYNDAFATFYRFGTKAECARTFAEYPDVLSAFFADGSPAPTEMWAVPRALRGERSNNAEYILSRKDTGETWVGSYSFGPILDESGAISGSVVVARDITDRKREQERLRASEQRFRQIFENAPTGIAIAGWGRAAGTMQSAFCELLGYTAEELHGVWFASLIPDGDREVAIADVGRLRAGDVPFFQCESRYLRKQGEPVWVHKLVSAMPHESGQARILVLVTDISQRKLAERKIQELNAGLEHRVRERTAQLEAANRELEAFAYSVSHDLRAPLRGIDGWSLAIVEDYGSQLDEKAHQYLDRVRSETQRMGLLIDDLLQLSRISRSPLHSGTVDLSAVASAVAARLREEYADRPIEFLIAPGLQVTGDARLLEVALTNLLGNAAKFTGRRVDARVEFGQTELDGRRTFYVRDNGVGFDMQFARNLFGAFQRLHKSSEFPGTGVGLATVQRIIHRHAGQTWAEALPGHGATFYFTIGGSNVDS